MAKKEIKLPEIGEGVTEGELVSWLVSVGDVIESDQAVVELMTDKATVEVPSPVAGKVLELKFQEGDMIAVESTILMLEVGASATSSSSKNEDSVSTPKNPSTSQAPQALSMKDNNFSAPGSGAMEMVSSQISPPPARLDVLATPAARRLARELNVDVNLINGTGLAGRVTREDILGFSGAGSQTETYSAGKSSTSASQSTHPALSIPLSNNSTQEEERVPLRGIRKKIAENMQMSKRVVPHFTLMDEANVTELVALRQSLKPVVEKIGVKVTYLPFIVKALISTIREFPEFNASIDDASSEIIYKKYFNVGVAADTPNGLLVPVIKSADQKTVLQIAAEIIDLSTRAREGKLKIDEMKGACFTITNIGSVGGTYATPIINHPEVAIFGVYKIQDKPILKDGELYNEKFMNFTVTCDHRLIDGAVAARFLASFIKKIENPGVLLMGMK